MSRVSSCPSGKHPLPLVVPSAGAVVDGFLPGGWSPEAVWRLCWSILDFREMIFSLQLAQLGPPHDTATALWRSVVFGQWAAPALAPGARYVGAAVSKSHAILVRDDGEPVAFVIATWCGAHGGRMVHSVA